MRLYSKRAVYSSKIKKNKKKLLTNICKLYIIQVSKVIDKHICNFKRFSIR